MGEISVVGVSIFKAKEECSFLLVAGVKWCYSFTVKGR